MKAAGSVSILDEALFRDVLARALGKPAALVLLTGQEPLKSRVHRLRFELEGRARSAIVKQVPPEIARRNRLVAERWLPAVGLESAAPRVLGIAVDPCPDVAWLVLEDLGSRAFSALEPGPARVEAAVALLARLHRAFADHALLGECRLWGGELGTPFHAGNLRDAIRAVEAVEPSGERATLRGRLLERLERMLQDAPRRAEQMQLRGGPETLLHGDPWLENLVETPRAAGLELRLIDWDHAGVGPIVYDVSTFLYRFPPRERRGVWQAYRSALGPGLWSFPAEEELQLLCETAEHARIANRLIWPALAVQRGEGEASWRELALVAGWFDELQPLFP